MDANLRSLVNPRERPKGATPDIESANGGSFDVDKANKTADLYAKLDPYYSWAFKRK